MGLFTIELDQLEHIQDSLGDDVGELLCQEIKARFQSVLRDCDLLSYFGGGQFAVLAEDL